MRSTGEVMGIDRIAGLAYAKAQMAAQPPLPEKGNVFISVPDREKARAVEIGRGFADLGFVLLLRLELRLHSRRRMFQ